MANYCNNCGKELSPTTTFCPQCGASIGYANGATTFLKVLSLLFPIVGWILFFLFRDENIKKARDCSKFAWIGFGINVVIGFVGGLASV